MWRQITRREGTSLFCQVGYLCFTFSLAFSFEGVSIQLNSSSVSTYAIWIFVMRSLTCDMRLTQSHTESSDHKDVPCCILCINYILFMSRNKYCMHATSTGEENDKVKLWCLFMRPCNKCFVFPKSGTVENAFNVLVPQKRYFLVFIHIICWEYLFAPHSQITLL